VGKLGLGKVPERSSKPEFTVLRAACGMVAQESKVARMVFIKFEDLGTAT
jgi:hypothetical protein